MSQLDSYDLAFNVVGDILIVSVTGLFTDEFIDQFQKQLLNKIHDRSYKGVLIDLSLTHLIDSYILRCISDTVLMLRLMGSAAIITGIKPAVVNSLVEFGDLSKHIRIALNTNEGIEIIESL